MFYRKRKDKDFANKMYRNTNKLFFDIFLVYHKGELNI